MPAAWRRPTIRPDRSIFPHCASTAGAILISLSTMIYAIAPAEIGRAVWHDLSHTIDLLLHNIINFQLIYEDIIKFKILT